MNRAFKVPFYPLTPVIGILSSLLLIFFLEPRTLLIGLELFIFGLIVYYIRMVGYSRICLAVGGMNFGISAFSAILTYLTISENLPIQLPQNVESLLFAIATLVSATYFVAGLLDIARKSE